MQSKIDELEMQKSGAVFGFNRASLCADSEIRKKREIFRLTEPLPALSKRQDFENAVNENQFIVVMGQTGSGKSTQLTQYLADMPQFEKQFVRYLVCCSFK
jgi:ATP-dependent RNA helicase DHX8/PRP22